MIDGYHNLKLFSIRFPEYQNKPGAVHYGKTS